MRHNDTILLLLMVQLKPFSQPRHNQHFIDSVAIHIHHFKAQSSPLKMIGDRGNTINLGDNKSPLLLATWQRSAN